MRSAKPISGTCHGIEVTHYFNKDTGLNVIINKNTKCFVSGWKLRHDQLENVIQRGSL